MFDAMDVGILSFVIAALAIEWHLTPSQMGWIGSVNSIGMAVGALGFGMFADKIGTEKCIYDDACLVLSGKRFVCADDDTYCISNFTLFCRSRTWWRVASRVDTWYLKVWKRMNGDELSCLLESFWAAGWLLAALIAYFVIPTFGWRIALIITALPAFYAIYLRRKLPDSPKFESDGKPKQSAVEKIKTLWSKKYARRTLMLWIVWFTVVFSYYGMFLWLPSVMVMKRL